MSKTVKVKPNPSSTVTTNNWTTVAEIGGDAFDLQQKVQALTRVLTKIACVSEDNAYNVIKSLVEQMGTAEWVTAQLATYKPSK